MVKSSKLRRLDQLSRCWATVRIFDAKAEFHYEPVDLCYFCTGVVLGTDKTDRGPGISPNYCNGSRPMNLGKTWGRPIRGGTIQNDGYDGLSWI